MKILSKENKMIKITLNNITDVLYNNKNSQIRIKERVGASGNTTSIAREKLIKLFSDTIFG